MTRTWHCWLHEETRFGPFLTPALSRPLSLRVTFVTVTGVVLRFVFHDFTGREQKNNFKTGGQGTFQLSRNNKIRNNIYPEGFGWEVDETTCFNKKTDVPELGDLLC